MLGDRAVMLGEGTTVSFLCIRGTYYIDGSVVSADIQESYYKALLKSPQFFRDIPLDSRDAYLDVIRYWDHKRSTVGRKCFLSSEELVGVSAKCKYIQALVEDAMLLNLKY